MHTTVSAQASASLASVMPRPQPTVPALNEYVTLRLDWVADEDESGNPKTPMAKIRFNAKTWKWEQVSVAEAGMLVFFNTAPDSFDSGFRIVSIVPNGRACYAEPE
jgi:hypothetical protein